jgi:threonine dehydrogenase-like Zn-dependent dehydrogenase
VVADTGQTRTGILEPLLDRGLRISTSRCGDFHQAVSALESLSAMGVDLGAVITDRLPVTDLRAAFDRAASPDSIKVVVSQP